MSQRQSRSRSAVPNSTNRSTPGGGRGPSKTNQRPPPANTRSQSQAPKPRAQPTNQQRSQSARPRAQTTNERSPSARPRTQTTNQRSQSANAAPRPANTRGQPSNLRSARSQSANPRSANTQGNEGSRPNRSNTGNPRARMQFYVRGPGPAGYVLPPLLGKPHHAVTHRIMPAPILGLKCYRDPPRYGPGPAFCAIKYGLKANGDYLGLKYTMRPRLDIKAKVKSPGPAIVNLNGKIDLVRPKLPTYTMRIRPPAFNKANYPAPNAYMLPSMLGPAVLTRPARLECTMKGDRKFKIFARSPGPVYDIGKVELVKSKAPVYTLRPKHGGKWENHGPGAAAYMLNKVIYPTRPAWMFGIKHTDFAGILKAQCDRLKMDPCVYNCQPTPICC